MLKISLHWLFIFYNFINSSLAGVMRTEYDTGNYSEMMARTSLLFKIAAKLKWLADTFKVAVVVINQVRRHLQMSSF